MGWAVADYYGRWFWNILEYKIRITTQYGNDNGVVTFNNQKPKLIDMKLDVSNLLLNELVELRDKINGMIWGYNDGHIYICKVRSYGRNWVDNSVKNLITLQELCYEYGGDDGIVDVYTTNTDLGENFSNYGETMIIKSLEDYEKWNLYNGRKSLIERAEQELIDDAEDQEKPYNQRRSHFRTSYTQEMIDEAKEELNNLPMDFEPPRNYFQYEDAE
jgi:hypothetical protein